MVRRGMWALHRGFRGQWDRYSPEHKRRGRVAGWGAAALLLVMTAFLVSAPLSGRMKIVVLVLAGALGMLVCAVFIAVAAVRESREANARRRARAASGR